MVKIIIFGYHGKMGQIIRKLIENDLECEIVAGIDYKPSAQGETFPVYSNIYDCTMPADVIIDFSTASAVPKLIDYAVKTNTPVVLCTTGLDDDILELVADSSRKIPIFKSANMSLGINLIASVLEKISNVLYEEGFDIEIIEKHHNQKIDAPSGTAFLLGDAIKNSVNDNLNYVYDRSQVKQKRSRNEIGMHAIRGGTIVGEHEVMFAGKDEVISLTHIAQSKELFAVGAVKAAKFLAGKPAGLYNMKDLTKEIIK